MRIRDALWVNDRRVLKLRGHAIWSILAQSTPQARSLYQRYRYLVRWRALASSRIINALTSAHDTSVQIADTSVVRGTLTDRKRRQSIGKSRV
jgi:hypothetical protein